MESVGFHFLIVFHVITLGTKFTKNPIIPFLCFINNRPENVSCCKTFVQMFFFFSHGNNSRHELKKILKIQYPLD